VTIAIKNENKQPNLAADASLRTIAIRHNKTSAITHYDTGTLRHGPLETGGLGMALATPYADARMHCTNAYFTYLLIYLNSEQMTIINAVPI